MLATGSYHSADTPGPQLRLAWRAILPSVVPSTNWLSPELTSGTLTGLVVPPGSSVARYS